MPSPWLLMNPYRLICAAFGCQSCASSMESVAFTTAPPGLVTSTSMLGSAAKPASLNPCAVRHTRGVGPPTNTDQSGVAVVGASAQQAFAVVSLPCQAVRAAFSAALTRASGRSLLSGVVSNWHWIAARNGCQTPGPPESTPKNE